MSKISFTAARISSFQCPEGKGQALFWDAKTPGLGLRITSGGSRSYVFESRVFGRTIRITIGSSDAWDLGQARTEAARLKVQIDQGVDPRLDRVAKVEAARAGARAASRQAATLGGAWDVYVASRRPYWSVRHHQDHVNHAAPGGEIKKRGTGVTQAGPIAALRAQRLTELSGAKVGSWLSEQAANRPTVSALSYRLLRGFIRWADESEEYRGLIPSDAYKARSVKDALPKIGAKHGDVLQREQLQSWFAAVRSLENGVASAYLQALLLTGARREELAVLRWEDVDFKWNTLVLNDKVEGTGGRTIPLTRYLSKLFMALNQENATPPPARRLQRWLKEGKTYGGPSPWVFASPTAASGYLAEPRSAHQRALAAGGLPHVTIHGLRRSFGTLSEWCEVPVGVVAQLQGHKPSAIAEKHYRRRPIDLLRKWHQEIEDWILCEAKISAVEISGN